MKELDLSTRRNYQRLILKPPKHFSNKEPLLKAEKELEEKTGIGHKLILEWVNLADLFRIKGVDEEYSDLLEEAGVDTVVELSKRVAENLHAKMLGVNEAKKLVRRPPDLDSVKDWIAPG